MSLRSAVGGEDRLARSARTAALRPGTATAKYENRRRPKARPIPSRSASRARKLTASER